MHSDIRSETINISLQLLGTEVAPLESVLRCSKVQHLASLNIQISRGWQFKPEVDLRLLLVDGRDADALLRLRREPILDDGSLTILVVLNAGEVDRNDLPQSRQSIVDTQVHFNGAESAVHREVEQFYRFILSAVDIQDRLACLDWADVRCVLLLTRQFQFKVVCSSDVETMLQAAECLVGQCSAKQLKRARSLLFYDHSPLALEGGRDVHGLGMVGSLIGEAVTDSCLVVMSSGSQLPEDGEGIVGLLLS